MALSDFSLKTKVAVIGILVFLPAMAGGTYYFFHEVQRYAALTAVSGLMNFVDAKQQGVIRFLGQNEKLAKSFLALTNSKSNNLDSERALFRALVKNDVFNIEEHPFKQEIKSGKRHIPTMRVYRAIDHVRNGTIVASSDPAREGKSWIKTFSLERGYSDVYFNSNKEPTISFGAKDNLNAVYIHADALMLTNITNGEIGNLEGDMGAFYLAGVGKTFDYYITNERNLMVTESRAHTDALLRASGSPFPWRATNQTANIQCNASGVYQTNTGATTGCREAMGFYTGINSKKTLGASMPFYDSNWTIIVEQEAEELFSPLYQLLLKVTIVGIMVAVIAFLLFIGVINYLVFRPLYKGLKGLG